MKISYKINLLGKKGGSVIKKIILISLYILFVFRIHASLIEFEEKKIILRNDFYSIEAVQIKENRIKTYIEISKELGFQIKINFDDETPREISISDGGEQLTVIVKNYEIESLYLNIGDSKKKVEKDQIDMTIIESVVEKVKSPFFIDNLWYRIQEREEFEKK